VNSQKFYLILSIACLLGYAWIFFQYTSQVSSTINTCFIKTLSGYPCPSCGATRSILLLVNGNFYKALLLNPFGIFSAFMLVILSPWLLFDFLLKRKSLHKQYLKLEIALKKPHIAIPLIIIVLLNWSWNIYKQL
jgi:hypothetical protein